MSALNPSRNATRVQAPPGGHSSISFGGEPPMSPSKAAAVQAPEATAKPATEAADAETPAEVTDAETPVPADDGPSLEALKLQAIGAIASAIDSADVRQAIANMLKQLPVVSSAAQDKSPDSAAASEPTEDAALAALKAALKLRGTHGILSIGKKFRSMDDNGDRKIAYDEFKKALVEMKLNLGEADMTRLFRRLDRDASGFITYDELLPGLRGELNERRLDMVKRCFKVLDKTGDGKVTLADLERRYDASRHPDVVAGTKSNRMVLLEFLGVFEGSGGGTAGDGQVEFDEFKAYYTLVSANIDNGPAGDDYFELMMRNVWHLSGGEGWAENTTCKRVLVVLEDDSQKVVELTDDFDVDTKDLAAVRAKLGEQGITGIKSVALYGDMSGGSSSVSASPSAASTPSSTSRSAASRRNPDHNRSSIVFG